MKRFLENFRRRLFIGGAVCCGLVVASLAQSQESESFMEHIRYLASDQMKGRGNGSEELEQAAEYIARHFREAGLLPAGEGNTYFQEFELTLGLDLGSENQITFQFKDGPIQLRPGEHYVPLTAGSQKRIEGPLVFVGFGITASELDYDDYGKLDVEGKIVVAFEHEPQERFEGSVFAGGELTPYATAFHKIMNARSRGAVGVILLPDYFNHPEGVSSPPEATQVVHLGIHTVRLTEAWGQRLISESGRDPDEITGLMSSQLTPQSFNLDYAGVVDLDVIKVRRTVRNVLGFIPGKTDEIIILGAHYDHLGLGSNGSLAADLKGQIHNGADDNASGTAGLLQLAEEFGADKALNVDESSPKERVARVREWTGGHGADVVAELSGSPAVIQEGLDMLRPGGRYLWVGNITPAPAEIIPPTVVRSSRTIVGVVVYEKWVIPRALQFLARTQHRTPYHKIISHKFPLAEINDAFPVAAKRECIRVALTM
ncbi:MAG: zinc-binding dehydrogenase [Acidobacteria bacterium]|nr:zinc-binding dehydrogenase [Acidobacteriota bacterium]